MVNGAQRIRTNRTATRSGGEAGVLGMDKVNDSVTLARDNQGRFCVYHSFTHTRTYTLIYTIGDYAICARRVAGCPQKA